MSFDVLIIGGGVFGAAIAERLSRTKTRVCLLEKHGDLAEGASKGNAGVVSSYFGTPGTLEARLLAASSPRWEDLCDRLNVPFRRIGSLAAAMDDEEAPLLHGLYEEAIACGARAEILTAGQAMDREPMLSSGCRGALYLPDDGIIDPMRLTCALGELAAINDCEIRLNSPVVSFERKGERLSAAITPDGPVEARYFINAAGLHADSVSRLAGGDQFEMWPRKGQYWILDRAFGARMRHIVDPVPIPGAISHGISVIPTSRGSVLLGPTADDEDDRSNKATDHQTLSRAFEGAKRLVPSISLEFAIKSFSGIRPACKTPFFVRHDRKVSNLIHAVCRSIGVSTSLGVADYVHDLLADRGLSAADKTSKTTRLIGPFNLRHSERPEEAEGLDETNQTVICVCEQVTVGEITAALRCRVPAQSIDGVWKRTGAGGGRCQGALCLTGITFLCAVHMNCPPHQVPVKDRAEIGVGCEAER